MSRMAGRVLAVSISKERGTRKYNIEGCMITEKGLEGDAHAGDWERQVSLLAIESVRELRPDLKMIEYGLLSENIMIEGLKIHTLPIGTKLKIGKEVILEITKIGKDPSEFTPEEAKWRKPMLKEGVFAKVIKPGYIKTGDKVTILQMQK